MQYRRMGRSGLKLSEVAVGSWMTDLKGREACDTAKEDSAAGLTTAA